MKNLIDELAMELSKAPITQTALDDCVKTIEKYIKDLNKGVEANKKEEKEVVIPPPITKFSYYIHELAKNNGISDKDMWTIFNNNIKRQPGATLDGMLWSIAYTMDERYPDNIKENKPLYRVFGLVYDHLHKYDVITNTRRYPLFRSREEATVAIKLLKPYVEKYILGKQ